MELPLYQVDAFTSQPFHGNAAAVVLMTPKEAACVSIELRQKIAAEMNLSETSFVEIIDDNVDNELERTFQNASNFKLSWYTPLKEAMLCGHATLAAAAAIITGEKNNSASLSFITNFSGTLTVRQGAEYSGQPQLEMDFPNEMPNADCPPWASPESPFRQALLGGAASLVETIRYNSRLRHMLIKLQKGTSREQLEAIQPELEKLLALVGKDKMIMAIFTTEALTDSQPYILKMHIEGIDRAGEYDILSRCFAPWSGIPEDPVTGSAHAVIGPWWAEQLGKTSLRARQCSKRGGELNLKIEGSRVKISGSTATVSKGMLYLPHNAMA